MEDRLLTQHRKLVVAKSVCTDLITTAHCSITTAHPGKNKSKQLIKEQYYWQGIDNNIKQFVSNCAACHWSKAPRDKTPRFLYLLPILDCP